MIASRRAADNCICICELKAKSKCFRRKKRPHHQMRNQNLPKYHRAPLNSLEMEKSPGHACQESPELCNEHSPHFPRAFPPMTAIQSLATPCEVGEDHILRDTGSCLLNTMWPREAKVGNRPSRLPAACLTPLPASSVLPMRPQLTSPSEDQLRT